MLNVPEGKRRTVSSCMADRLLHSLLKRSMDVSRAYKEPSKRGPASGEYGWLIELRDRLAVAVEVLDGRGHLPLPAQSSELSQRLRRWLSDHSVDSVSAAAERSRQAGDVVFVNVEGLRVGIFSLPQGGGVTLFAAEAADERPEEARRHYLQALMTWLARGEGIPGSNGVASVQDWRELRILEQVLAQAASAGAEREVVRAFVEAIAVWHDIDTRGYVADLNGRFTLDVMLPRAHVSAAPGTLPPDVRDWSGATYLTAREAAEWGFGGGNNAVVVKLNAAGITPRAVAFIAALQPYDEVRLSIYVDLLRRALQSAAGIESSRLIWAIMQRLAANHESSEDALFAAATELSQSAICTVALTVRRGDGVKVVAVELAGDGADGTSSGSETLSFPLPLTAPFSGTLTLRRPPGHPFTERERRVGEVATSVLASWLAAALRSGRLYRDRRALSGNFDDLISQGLGRASDEGADLSVVVFRPIPEDEQVDRRQAWVGEIRRQLRPFDVAGTLTTGEIGVLLPNTPADCALAVAERLRRSFQNNSELSGLSAASVGIASRGSGSTSSHLLVDQARENAASGASRPQ